MLYQTYREKLNDRTRRLLTLWKWRFPLLAALLCLCVGALLLGLTGTVYGLRVPQNALYGDPYSPSATAVCGTPAFEYRPEDGGEWSSEAPVRAGRYRVRAVGRALGGKLRYSREASFVIAPRPLVILVDDAFSYGDAPAYSAAPLPGDALSGVTFAEEWLDSAALRVWVDPGPVRLTNAAGEDVTPCYTLFTPARTCYPTRRTLLVRTASAEWQYDADPHTAPACEITGGIGLVPGHTLQVGQYPALSAAGSVPNAPALLRVLDEAGQDVTVHYDVRPTWGTLTVTPCPVTLSTPDATFVYDGGPHDCPEVLAVGLAPGHTLQAQADDWAQVTWVGSTPNRATLSLRVLNGEEDVSANYAFSAPLFGTLTLTPCPLSVQTPSQTWVYDGQAHELPTYTASALPAGHTLRVAVTGAITGAGTAPNTATATVTLGAGGRDVSQNFAVTWAFGVLKVEKRTVKATSPSGAFAWDGTPKRVSADAAANWGVLPGERENEGLLDGHRVTSAAGTARTDPTDTLPEGSVPNVPTFRVTDGRGADVSANYAFVPAAGGWGRLTIYSPIEVTLHTLTKTYDGTPLVFPATALTLTRCPAAWQGQVTLTLTAAPSLTEVGTLSLAQITAAIEVRKPDTEDGALAATRILFAGEDAPLRVLARPITVTSLSVSALRPTDGTPLTAPEAWVSTGSLLPGHRLVATVTGSLAPDADEAPNTIGEVHILDEAEQDVTRFYAVTRAPGTLRFLPASAYDLAFERGNYAAQTAKIGGAFDVTAALKEAVKRQTERNFQSYTD